MYNNKTSRRAPKKTKINQISEPMAGRDINVIIEQYQEKLSIMYQLCIHKQYWGRFTIVFLRANYKLG